MYWRERRGLRLGGEQSSYFANRDLSDLGKHPQTPGTSVFHLDLFVSFSFPSLKQGAWTKWHVVSIPLLAVQKFKTRVSVCVLSRSVVRLFAIPWTVAHQAPLSIGFSRQEYWRGLPFPSPGDLPNPGIELRTPESPLSPALAGRVSTSEPPGKNSILQEKKKS